MTNEQRDILDEIEKQCTSALKEFSYQELNDETFDQATKVLIDILDLFYRDGKVNGFDAFCDRLNNTNETIDRCELHGRAIVFFHRTNGLDGEKVILDFTIKPTPVHEIPNNIVVNKS